MLYAKQLNRMVLALPFLQKADASLVNELKRETQFVKIPAGHEVFPRNPSDPRT